MCLRNGGVTLRNAYSAHAGNGCRTPPKPLLTVTSLAGDERCDTKS